MKRNLFLATAVSALVGATPAYASFHLMQIEQVIAGVGGHVDRQAIQLRMRDPVFPQNLVSNARIRAWDATGLNPVVIIDFATNVTNGILARVLVVSSAFASAYGAGDFVMTNPIPASYLAAGRLTFEDDLGNVYWSLGWGGSAYTGSNLGLTFNDGDGDFGPPFGSGLPASTAAAVAFTGIATAASTTNLADYAITAGAATFTTNGGVTRPLPSDIIFGDGFES